MVLLQTAVLLRFARTGARAQWEAPQEPATRLAKEQCDSKIAKLDANPKKEDCAPLTSTCGLSCADLESDVVVFWRGKPGKPDPQAMKLLRYSLRSGFQFLFADLEARKPIKLCPQFPGFWRVLGGSSWLCQALSMGRQFASGSTQGTFAFAS
jgi:hypothetical protein